MQCLSITLQCGGLLHLKALASIKLRNAATSTRKVSWHSDERSTRLELLCIFFAFWFGIIALSKISPPDFFPMLLQMVYHPRAYLSKVWIAHFFRYNHLSIVWDFGEIFWGKCCWIFVVFQRRRSSFSPFDLSPRPPWRWFSRPRHHHFAGTHHRCKSQSSSCWKSSA